MTYSQSLAALADPPRRALYGRLISFAVTGALFGAAAFAMRDARA